MHISDGVLSPTMIAVTSLAGAGVVAYSLRGIRTPDLSRISLMTALFFVGSTVHLPIGPTSVHLLLTGLVGLVVGRHAAAAVLITLLLQLFLLHFGGLSSLGANVLIESLPAMLLGMLLRPKLSGAGNAALAYSFTVGFAAGFLAILGSVFLLGFVLIQSNLRYGQGPFSTVSMIAAGHVPLMFVEGLITGFAVQFIVKVRPGFFHLEPEKPTENPNNEESPVTAPVADRP